jgi:hypothetical protein
VNENLGHVTHLNHHFILIPIVALLFVVFSFARSEPTSPPIQVSSGIYLRNAPPDMVLFRDHAIILFRVNFGFHHREDHLHHLLISSCAVHEAHYRSLCLLAVPLTRNLQSLNEKLDFIHSAMTNEPALRPLSPPAVPTIPTTTTTTRRTTTTATTTSTPEEQQITGLVTNLLRGRRETSSYRPKRQIFLAGIAAGFIGTKLFSYFDHTTMDMPTMYKELTKGMDKINLHNIQEATAINLLKNQTSNQIRSAITEFNRRFANFRNETTKLARELHYGELRMLLLLTESLQEQVRTGELFQYSLILAACTSGRLPSSAITPAALRKELAILSNNLADRNFTLVIPHTDISSYFFHELAHCHFNHQKDEIVISLSVPIKRRNIDYSLVETIAVPFLDSSTFNNTELCTVEISHQLVVIERSRFSTNTIPIDSAHSSRCSLKTRLCFYNEFSSSSRIATDCMCLLLAGSTAQYLREACPFHCRPARINDTSVISLESQPDQTRIFAVTNPPPNSAIICEFENGTIASDTPVTFDNPIGSYLISISNCLYHIRLNTRIIRMTPFLIPSRWANLTSSYVLLS